MERLTNEEMQELNGLIQLVKEQEATMGKAKFIGELVLSNYNARMKTLLEEKGLDTSKKYVIGVDNELIDEEEYNGKPEDKPEAKPEGSKK